MKLPHILMLAAAMTLASISTLSCKNTDEKACCNKGAIEVAVPERPAGQETALGMTADPIEIVRVGFIGLGDRGTGAVPRYCHIPGVEIKALCDVEPDRVERSQQILAYYNLPAADSYSGPDAWKQVCEREDIDLIYICTDWINHTPIALYAMEHNKHVAIEVPAATTLDEIWDLINTSERTRKHCMMLENCVYDFFEMTALKMAQEGMFGEIIHAEGAYQHNLDPYWKGYWHNWRLDFNHKNRGDVYPTHGIGPICQALNIHRGDRMMTLVSMDTAPFNGPKHVQAQTGEECTDFKNGDQTCTLIRTENGKTMLIEHDVMTPRPYSRMYQLVGTDGYAGKYPVGQICLRTEGHENVAYDNLGGELVYMYGDLDALMAQHRSDILTPELETLAKQVGGHGGMDFIMDYRLIYCLQNGLPLDMDVYDLAEWCCLGELSRISLEHGNMPVAVPDFTRGAWKDAEGKAVINGFHYAFAE